MKLTINEMKLITQIPEISDLEIERKSDREFDLSIIGMRNNYPFSAWMPLLAINEMIDWSMPKIAQLSDYHDMVRSGDWSGIRDTNEEKLWIIFHNFIIPIIKG